MPSSLVGRLCWFNIIHLEEVFRGQPALISLTYEESSALIDICANIFQNPLKRSKAMVPKRAGEDQIEYGL